MKKIVIRNLLHIFNNVSTHSLLMATNRLLPGVALGGAGGAGGAVGQKPWAVRSLNDFLAYIEATGFDNATDDIALNAMGRINLPDLPTNDIDVLNLFCDVEESVCPHRTSAVSPLVAQLLRKKGERNNNKSSPTYRDDRLHAHERIKKWDDKLFRRVFLVTRRVFRQIFDKMILVYPKSSASQS